MQTTPATWIRSALSCLLALTLFGCLRPYSKSVFDPSAAQFPGIISQWNSTSGSDIRVLFVHGICTHDANGWITPRWDLVMKGYFPSESMTATSKPPVGQVQVIDRENEVGANKLSGCYLIWSALTAADKAQLNYDNLPTDSPRPSEFIWKRAEKNAKLKASLLSDCLADGVIYAGYRGADIQASMQNTICEALYRTTSNGTRSFPPTYSHGSRRIVIVTESLGSRIVLDAISAFTIEAEKKGAKALFAFDEAVSPITQIYMLGDPLLILALSRPALTQAAPTTDATTSRTPAMATALSVLSDARVRHHGKHPKEPRAAKLSLVAFTDPNGLLSCRLLPNDPVVLGADTRVVNVIASNDTIYIGDVENPLNAHTIYNQNSGEPRILFGG
jgi:hypothetical protein